MADNFDLNDTGLYPHSDMPELTVTDEQVVTENTADQPKQAQKAPRRRKKRVRRPKWQRMLWKYWPPVRFGLIILAGILFIWLIISCIGELFAGPDVPEETEPSASTVETTDPTDETTDPTTEPTTEPTEPPVTDPYAGAVTDDWYENTLFIGDFNTEGLRNYARAGNADYFCSSGMGVFNYDEVSVSDTNFEKQDIASLLTAKTYDKIIINLGINNCGYPTSSLINGYSKMITTIREAQPNAKIILHGIMLVTESYADRADYFSASHITGVNDRIRELADGVNIFYIDLNESFADENGYLNSRVSTDGCHFNATGYEDWAKLISVELGKLGIE